MILPGARLVNTYLMLRFILGYFGDAEKVAFSRVLGRRSFSKMELLHIEQRVPLYGFAEMQSKLSHTWLPLLTSVPSNLSGKHSKP